MVEQIELAKRYARMLWGYRWIALLFSAVICTAGWFYVLSMPNTYEVNAKVFVDTSSMLRPLLKGLAVDSSMLSDSAALMKRTLLTRPNLEEVARKTDLDLEATTPRQFETMIGLLSQRIRLSGTGRDNVYEIKFEDTNAQRAKNVVDALLNTFLETALGSSRTDSAATQKFLEEQIAVYEKRLVEAEERLKNFKQRNVGLVPGTESNYYQRLELAKTKRQEAELELREAQRRRDELRKSLQRPGSGEPGEVNLQDPVLLEMSTYTPRIKQTQDQLDQLLLNFTEKHPDIVVLRERLADYETRREEELVTLAKQMSDKNAIAGAAPSEAMMTTALAVAEAEAQAAALEARVANYNGEVDKLERMVDTIPEIEAELVRLDRDYGLNKRQFEELLKRREAARLSDEVDQKAEDVKIKVIEPPKVPLVPSGPKRKMFFSAVFFAALGAGAALAFVLSQIQQRFYTIEELKEFMQLPLLGAVSYQSSARYRTERRMELAVFLLIFCVLAGVYGGLLTLEAAHVDLHAKLAAVMGSSA